MKRTFTISLLCLSLIICSSLPSFSQNALNFDGLNDYVNIPNATAHIANTTNMAISCWVYPTKIGGPYGIVGIRNNSSADFYILQLTATSVECRFRNSFNVNYDVVFNGLILNQWQHFVFTYDTDTLRLYHNGIAVAKLAATGMITNTTTEMRIGVSPWTSGSFWFEGNIDEVSLWDKTISASEAMCMYNSGVNPNASGLKLYYDFDHGTANGNNAGVTTLTDRKANINGTLTGFTLSGTASNWVNGVSTPTVLSNSICLGDSVVIGTTAYYETGTYFHATPVGGCDSITSLHLTVTAAVKPETASFCQGTTYNFRGKSLTAGGTYYDTAQTAALCDTVYKLTLTQRPSYNRTIDKTICLGESYTVGTTVFNTEGSYTETLASRFGCDSVINLNLDVDTVDAGISTNSGTLIASADQNTNTYQWYDCNAGVIIPNETNKFFNIPAVTPPGAYAVIVTHTATNCSDTSQCLGRLTGIEDSEDQIAVTLIPNPVKDKATIHIGGAYQSVSLNVINANGAEMLNTTFSHKQSFEIDTKDWPTGIYFVRILADNRTKVVKMMKD